jgi:MFS family permease
VQGLGAAIVSPAALSIITTTFADGAERNRALGIWGAVTGAGGAAGVLLGGILTSGLSWRWRCSSTSRSRWSPPRSPTGCQSVARRSTAGSGPAKRSLNACPFG